MKSISFINEIHHQLLINLNSGDRESVLHSLELLDSSMEIGQGESWFKLLGNRLILLILLTIIY